VVGHSAYGGLLAYSTIDHPVRTGKGLPELAEELAHVVDEQIGRFHRREVSALLELREMSDLALRVYEATQDRVGVEDGPPLRCRRRGQPVEWVVSTLVIEPGRGTKALSRYLDPKGSSSTPPRYVLRSARRRKPRPRRVPDQSLL
jgi:hypothetical protein